MIEFTHETTRYTVKSENAPKLREILAKPKKHKPVALSSKNLLRNYPQFVAGMSTSDYVHQFNRQFEDIQHKIVHECPRYHMPAPMLDASTPECVEDENPDYVEPVKISKPKRVTVSKELAAYIASYIAYELDRTPHGLVIDSFMVLDAVEAFNGGAR